ncbi:MAG: hypothetical protein WD078_05395 [Woeseia sp.]
MILYLIVFLALCLVMVGMSLKILLGRSTELKRGCGTQCECVANQQVLANCKKRGRQT